MQSRFSSLLCLGLGAIIALPALSQLGHPAKGSWSGYWGPNADERHRVLLLLDTVNDQLSGVLNPGRNAVEIDRVDLDASTWTLTIEANMPIEDGTKRSFVVIGTLENLGSWTNRTYTGTYTHGDERGDFAVSLN